MIAAALIQLWLLQVDSLSKKINLAEGGMFLEANKRGWFTKDTVRRVCEGIEVYS